jgi:hypothetical protein
VVVLWKLQNLAEHRRHAQAHSGPVTALRFLGNSLFSAGSDQHLKWWDVPSGDVVADFVMHASPVLDLATAVGPAGSAGVPRSSATFPSSFVIDDRADGWEMRLSLLTLRLSRRLCGLAGRLSAGSAVRWARRRHALDLEPRDQVAGVQRPVPRLRAAHGHGLILVQPWQPGGDRRPRRCAAGPPNRR